MTTDAPLSWVDASTEEGRTCPPNEGKIAGGCRSASIRTQGQARHLCSDETKARCRCTRSLRYCVRKEANINSVHIHGPHTMLLP